MNATLVCGSSSTPGIGKHGLFRTNDVGPRLELDAMYWLSQEVSLVRNEELWVQIAIRELTATDGTFISPCYIRTLDREESVFSIPHIELTPSRLGWTTMAIIGGAAAAPFPMAGRPASDRLAGKGTIPLLKPDNHETG